MEEQIEIQKLATFENKDAVVGFVRYCSDGETEFKKKFKWLTDVGWYIIDAKSHEEESISNYDDYKEIKNPFKSFDRIAPLLEKLGIETMPTNIEKAYEQLLNAVT